jgi:hypothetical protein
MLLLLALDLAAVSLSKILQCWGEVGENKGREKSSDEQLT